MVERASEFAFNPTAARFGVKPIDPGWVYFVEHEKKYKIGRSANPSKRFKEARTWIPDINIIGVKPFWGCTFVERVLHISLVWHWKANEWHQFIDDEHEEFILDEFRAFDDFDINKNSIDFIYFMNGSGLSEFTLEFSSRKATLGKWRKDES